jgi:NAD(P)-dependent dehydrogenase (short-subunit alcohol dehydrogenase family)
MLHRAKLGELRWHYLFHETLLIHWACLRTADWPVQEQYGPLRGTVAAEECELASITSIKACAQRWEATGRPIDVLSLNAGAQFVGQKEAKRTADGFELTIGVNHLGHFLLANMLLANVEASTRHPRIVVTASEVWLPACSHAGEERHHHEPCLTFQIQEEIVAFHAICLILTAVGRDCGQEGSSANAAAVPVHPR